MKICRDKIYGTVVGEDRKPHVPDVQEPMCCILGGSDDVWPRVEKCDVVVMCTMKDAYEVWMRVSVGAGMYGCWQQKNIIQNSMY